MTRLKVYIADDHTLFRKAFVRLLRDCNKVGEIKEAADGKELLRLVNEDIPDVVIVDVQMPVMGGVKVCEKLWRSFPEVKIMVLSMFEEKLIIAQTLQYGARAFLPKVSTLEEFESALDDVISGKRYSNQMMEEALLYVNELEKIQQHDPRQLKVEFTDREKTIIAMTCQELSSRQIGAELNLSEHTIRNHRVRIMKKAGVKTLQGLAQFAVANGMGNYR
jgi:two-component system response regulator DegU